MTKKLNPRSLIHSLTGLLGTKAEGDPHKRFPVTYYKHIYLDKQMYDGIELVGAIERLSKKKAARFLLERGFSSYMGEKLKTEMAIRELERKPHLTRFVLELRRFARERGMDISKFKF